MKKWFLLIISGVLLIALVLVFFFFKNRKVKTFVVQKELTDGSVSADMALDTSFVTSGKNLVRFDKEGSEAVAPDGTKLWNITYSTMKNPSFSFCGEMTAVADLGAKQYYLTEGDGIARPFTVPFPIQAICVASQGVTAVLMNDIEKDYVNLYDKEGTLLSEICTIVQRDGFPVAIALSPDGKKLVTSYVEIDNDEALTNLTFFNFGEVGKNYTRNLVGQVQYQGSLVPRLSFLENDAFVAVGERELEFFSVSELPSSVNKISLSANIKSIAVGDYFCVVLEDPEMKQDVLYAYNSAGTQVLKKGIGITYIGLHTAGKDIAVYSYTGCDFYRIGEGLCLSATMENGVRSMLAVGDGRFYLVEERAVKVIKLKK